MTGKTNMKVALVTGASSGIGRQIAIQLAKSGVYVYINFSKSKQDADAVKQEIEFQGGHATIVQADITQEQDVISMLEYIKDSSGKLDFLINNAGIYEPDFIESHTTQTWDRVLDINLKGKMLCTKYAVNLLKQSGNPRIINIATRAAVNPMEESSAYCCAAAGIVMLTQVSAIELAKYNIKVNTISPGLTKTPMTEVVDSDEEFDNYAQRNPSKRVGTPVDIANAVEFLLSDKADFINGENINVSGGILLM